MPRRAARAILEKYIYSTLASNSAFEAIELQYQAEKEKEQEKKISPEIGNFYVLFIGTSTITLCIGEIYQLNIKLETLLEQLRCTISEINLSSSSNSTSTSCVSLQKQQENQSKEKRRPCLSWRIKRNGVEVLPIATFEGRDLKTPDKTAHTTLSTEFLLKHVLSIYPRKSPANKKLLKPKVIKHISKPLSGYLLLMDTVMSDQVTWHIPMPVLFDQ
ncbi:unnamed protein product [Rotaria sordida]|uniref:Uncharacterized protein n=1 Tax=Rotaria sordida TaxID=392033 RepID=A0A815BTB7_9BILA|nr:unnamed protein product [Rotaria sordida]